MIQAEKTEMTKRGGCHCGRVAFEVEGSPSVVEDCNCSLCGRTGFLHWRIEPEQLHMLTPWESLSVYVWGTGRARHYFCPVCGISPLRNPRSDPSKININVRCLEGIDLSTLEIEHFDGTNWKLDQNA